MDAQAILASALTEAVRHGTTVADLRLAMIEALDDFPLHGSLAVHVRISERPVAALPSLVIPRPASAEGIPRNYAERHAQSQAKPPKGAEPPRAKTLPEYETEVLREWARKFRKSETQLLKAISGKIKREARTRFDMAKLMEGLI
jgi:hypothetical protein